LPPDDIETAWETGPVANPVDRFAHLPEPTRKWLESLREDDVKDLAETVRMMHSAKTIGKFGKWLIVTIFVALVSGVAAGEAIVKIFKWIVPGNLR
jgi:hypothetical protein